MQENRPAGTSVLQLTVTDRDATHNGPPFTFALVGGNEGEAFALSQQGELQAVGEMNRRAREHYLLEAQVSRAAAAQEEEHALLISRSTSHG